LKEVVVLDLFPECRVPIKVCNVCRVLFKEKPAVSGVASSVLGYIFVSEEFDVDVFVGIGVFNPIPSIFCIAVPMSESGTCPGKSPTVLV